MLEVDYSIHTLPACSKCGYLNPQSAKFCQQCGEPLASPLTTEQVSETPLTAEAPTKRGMTGVEKAVLVGAILVIILVIGVFASMSYSPSRTAPTPPPATPSWHYVASYSHSYSGSVTFTKATSPFTIRGAQFRYNWSYSALAPQYGFSMLVQVWSAETNHTADLMCIFSNPYVEPPANCKPGADEMSGTEYVHSVPGSFYLFIASDSVDWSITVEDYY